MKFAASIIFTLGCVIACNQAFAGKVYKWVDDKGVVHFSAQPPLNKQSEVIKPQISQGTPAGEQAPVGSNAGGANTGQANKSVSSSSSPSQIAPSKDSERCEAARKNEQALKTYSRIKVTGDDGEFRFLTDAEKQQKLDEANMAIQESCE